MSYSAKSIKKVGEIFVDLGKYVLTAVPIAYFVSSAHDLSWFTLTMIATSGILMCLAGIHIINTAENMEVKETTKKGKYRKIKLQKNTTIVVEEF